MHVDDIGRSAAFVQIVDVLRHKRQVVFTCQIGKGVVGGIGPRIGNSGPIFITSDGSTG